MQIRAVLMNISLGAFGLTAFLPSQSRASPPPPPFGGDDWDDQVGKDDDEGGEQKPSCEAVAAEVRAVGVALHLPPDVVDLEARLALLDCRMFRRPVRCDADKTCRIAAEATIEAELASSCEGGYLGDAVRKAVRRCERHCPSQLETCVAAASSPGGDDASSHELAYQEALLRTCFMPSTGACLTTLTARINLDCTRASIRATAPGDDYTPAQALAVILDRSAKLTRANADHKYAAQLCQQPDDDGDFVPNAVDQCPDTPPLVATDAAGCAVTTVPDAPSREVISSLASGGGLILNPKCEGTPPLGKLPSGVFYVSGHEDIGLFLVTTRAVDIPAGCPVWYEFEVSASHFVDEPPRYSGVSSTATQTRPCSTRVRRCRLPSSSSERRRRTQATRERSEPWPAR